MLDASGDVTGPAGDPADAVAALRIVPASMSACVTVYVPVHENVSFGAMDAAVQPVSVTPATASVIRASVTVTLPVFVMTNV